MTPAHTYPHRRDGVRLLVVDPSAHRFAEIAFSDLLDRLQPGDALVVNDAATLPASLSGTDASGRPVEARLLARRGLARWDAVLFGAGSWRTRTEERPPPPPLAPGDALTFGSVVADVTRVDARSPRFVELELRAADGDLAQALYRHGRVVQYAYLAHELPLWAVQNVYASRPWALEMPSAGRPLSWDLLIALRRRGVSVARLTHAAGLSSTGDARLDAALPWAERYDVPQSTVDAVAQARARGGRVVAVGTSVVRALEAAWDGVTLRAGTGETTLRIDERFRPRVVDGLLTGLHADGESHFELLSAFCPRPLLAKAVAAADLAGFRAHELGDAMLVLADRPAHSVRGSAPA